MPDRAYRVDDMRRRQAVAAGKAGLAGRTAAQSAAFGEQLGTRGPMDGAVDPTPAEQ